MKDGFYALPPDRLATLVTWLRRDVPESLPVQHLPVTLQLERLGSGDGQRFLALFRTIGERWMWFSRLRMENADLAVLLGDPALFAFALTRDGQDIGLLEMDYRNAALPELSFLGLTPNVIGQGLGKALMAQALAHARGQAIKELHLHTCTFDHPGAVAFYQAMGFEPYRREVEIFVDPRIDGTLAPDAVTGFPLILGG